MTKLEEKVMTERYPGKMEIEELIKRAHKNHGKTFADKLSAEIETNSITSIDDGFEIQRTLLNIAHQQRSELLQTNVSYRSRLVKPLMKRIHDLEESDIESSKSI